MFFAEVLGLKMYSGGCVKSTMMDEHCDHSTDCMNYEQICVTEDFPKLGKGTSCQCKTNLCNGSSQLESRTSLIAALDSLIALLIFL